MMFRPRIPKCCIYFNCGLLHDFYLLKFEKDGGLEECGYGCLPLIKKHVSTFAWSKNSGKLQVLVEKFVKLHMWYTTQGCR